jgi:uncharacterized membrane protein YeaQ/YmgE (transglycosylase-associated protein family)
MLASLQCGIEAVPRGRFDFACCLREDGNVHNKENIMALESLIVLLIVGAIAGWLAGQVVRGFGFGLVGNIVVGIVGAVIAGWLFPRLGISLGGGIIGSIIAAAIGAVILLFVIGLIRR